MRNDAVCFARKPSIRVAFYRERAAHAAVDAFQPPSEAPLLDVDNVDAHPASQKPTGYAPEEDKAYDSASFSCLLLRDLLLPC